MSRRILPRKSILASAAALALLTSTLTPQSAHAAPVLEFTPPKFGTLFANLDYSIGWEFTTNSDLTVTALDAASVNPTNGSQVRIYTASGTILASATVLTSDSTEAHPVSFLTHPITPVTLTSGQTYYIAEDHLKNDPSFLQYSTLGPVDPSITYVASLSALNTGVNPTTNLFGMPDGYFGPDFDIPTSAVPEPASLSLLTLAAAALLTRRRRVTK